VELQSAVDNRVAASSETKWCKDLFIPASTRHKKRFGTIERKKKQINEVWPDGDWEKTLDPSKVGPLSLN
jgi:hypothetical protein